MYLEKGLHTYCLGTTIIGDALVGVFKSVAHFETTVEVRLYIRTHNVAMGPLGHNYVIQNGGTAFQLIEPIRRGHVISYGDAFLVERSWRLHPA